MSQTTKPNPTPLPPPKFVLFAGSIAIAAILYLISAALEAEREVGNLSGALTKGEGI